MLLNISKIKEKNSVFFCMSMNMLSHISKKYNAYIYKYTTSKKDYYVPIWVIFNYWTFCVLVVYSALVFNNPLI